MIKVWQDIFGIKKTYLREGISPYLEHCGSQNKKGTKKGGAMEWQELIIDGYGRVLEILNKALAGLTLDDLNEQPHPDCNSIGWLTWHLTRVQDDHVADLMGEEQLWIKDKW
ncbi:MAG: hypothetical protein GTN76_01790, partial [Candidatus Aenigmarchaeota archaeon]|nr:hypothetical protein [Candidatus Aenigmarchaeota archaeon]